MLFTVIGPDGSIKASTDYIQCIYNNDTLVSMDRCGYKFELYGKRIRIRMLLDELAKLRNLPQPLQSKPYSEVNAAAETTVFPPPSWPDRSTPHDPPEYGPQSPYEWPRAAQESP